VASAFEPSDHDHSRCVADALAAADRLCEAQGQRLTPLRRRVLELVWLSHSPVGAYDLLALLSRDGRRAAPPTVYRALEFLTARRLVHRIDSLNAFVGCVYPGLSHRAYFLICDGCGSAAELDDPGLRGALETAAKRAGFAVREETVELRGRCPNCAAAA